MKFIDGDFTQKVDVEMDASVKSPFENLDITKLSSAEKEKLETILEKMSGD